MALTRVAPAGIGSTPGTGYVIGDSFLHSRGLNATDGYYTGIVTTQSLRVIGDLEVEGTTTTLDTALTEVDKLEVGANNNTVGVAITQSGTGDILNLYDGSTEVFSVRDGGNVGIKNATGLSEFPVDVGGEIASKNANKEFIGINLTNNEARIRSSYYSGASGAYRPITFYTSDAERLRIQPNGKVGIGTNNPTNTLEISKVDNHGITLRRPAGSANPGTVKFEVHSNGAGRLVSERDFNINFDTDDLGNQNFSVSSNGSERFRIKSNGSVGIGTDNPESDQLLTIHGTSNYKAGIRLRQSSTNIFKLIPEGGTGNVYYDLYGITGSLVGDHIFRVKNGQEKLRIKSDGKVGIGTNNPIRTLDVHSGSSTDIVQFTNDSGTTLTFGAYSGMTTLDAPSSTGFRFRSGGSSGEHFTITSNGNIGFSSATPTQKFQFVGGMMGIRQDNALLYFANSSNANGTGLAQKNSFVGRVDNAGSHVVSTSGGVGSSAEQMVLANCGAGGILLGTANSGSFATGRLLIAADGNVGVGDDDPSVPFNVKAGGASFAGQTTHVKIEDTTSLAANVGGLLAFEGVYNSNGDPACYAMIHGGKTNADNGNYAGYLRFFTRPSGALPQERLRIASDGDIEYKYDDADTSSEVGATQLPHGLRIFNTNNTLGRLAGIHFSHGLGGTANAGIFHETTNTASGSTTCLGDLVFYTKNSGVSYMTEKLRITSGGQVIVNGTANLAHPNMDDIIVGDASGNRGITVASGSSGFGTLAFGDSTDGSGNDRYQGFVEYYHSDNSLRLGTVAQERFRIASDGQVYIGGSSENSNSFSDAGTFLNLKNDTYGGRIGFSNNTATAGVALMEQFAYWGNNKISGIVATAGSDTSNKDDGDLRFYTRTSGQAVTERLRIQSNGVLKLSTPGNVVDGTFYASQIINNTGSTTYSRIRFDRSDVAKFGLTLRDDDKFCISNLFKNGSVSADDEAFVMTNSSNIGIGFASPQTALNVKGTISTGRNLAREVGTVISYSNQFNSSRSASNVINGKKNYENGNNDWLTPGNARDNAWVVIDLGAQYEIDRVVIYNQNEYSDSRREVKRFNLEGSNDNSSWTLLIDDELGRSDAHEPNPGFSFRLPHVSSPAAMQDDNEGVSYRYWKFHMKDFHSVDSYGGIMEIELYGASNAVDSEVSTHSVVASDVYTQTLSAKRLAIGENGAQGDFRARVNENVYINAAARFGQNISDTTGNSTRHTGWRMYGYNPAGISARYQWTQDGFHGRKSFYHYFPNGSSNQAIRFHSNRNSFWTCGFITINALYSHQNASGMLRYHFRHNANGSSNYGKSIDADVNIGYTSGNVGMSNNYTFKGWSNSNGGTDSNGNATYSHALELRHLTSTGNGFYITFELYGNHMHNHMDDLYMTTGHTY